MGSSRSQAGVKLGSSWDQAGVKLGSSWGQAGVKLGSSWGQAGVKLGSSWGQAGVKLGSSWGQAGVKLRSSWGAPAPPYHHAGERAVAEHLGRRGAQRAGVDGSLLEGAYTPPLLVLMGANFVGYLG